MGSHCVCFGRYVKDTCLAIYKPTNHKHPFQTLWARDAVTMWKRPLLPRKLPPCVGIFLFAVTNLCKNNFAATQVRITGQTRHTKSCPSDQRKNLFPPVRPKQKWTVLCHSNRRLPNVAERPELCLWKDHAEPKNTKVDNCKHKGKPQRECCRNLQDATCVERSFCKGYPQSADTRVAADGAIMNRVVSPV